MWWSFLAILASAAPARADIITYQLAATPTADAVRWGFGTWSLQYSDSDFDTMFNTLELVPGSFSGVWLGSPIYDWFPILKAAAGSLEEGAYADEDFHTPGVVPRGGSWAFLIPDGMQASVSPSLWTYTREIVPDPSAVPLPPSALLLGAGLIPLSWARRKKRLGQ